MLKSKKGVETGGTQVMVILIVIALFMTLYILFIPPSERKELLGETQTTTTATTQEGKVELLAESPGQLTPTTELDTVHKIPSVSVFLKTEPKIISLANSLVVSNGLFSKSFPKLKFKTENLDETTKLALFFSIEGEPSGELKVKANGNTVYTEEIETSGIKIIEIAKSFLQKENELVLSASSPGIAFWSTNKYNLKDIGIKQEFERKNTEESRTFNLPPAEKENLVKVMLKYFQVCNAPLSSDTVSLDILLNEQRVHSAEISCITTEQQLDLDPDLLQSGNNILTFRLEEGDFTFNQIKVETELQQADRPTYFFSLAQKEFSDIKSGSKKVKLEVLLEGKQTKMARLLINNNELLMQTDKTTFEKDLKDFVTDGTNFIKISPINSFNMVGLKVTLE